MPVISSFVLILIQILMSILIVSLIPNSRRWLLTLRRGVRLSLWSRQFPISVNPVVVVSWFLFAQVNVLILVLIQRISFVPNSWRRHFSFWRSVCVPGWGISLSILSVIKIIVNRNPVNWIDSILRESPLLSKRKWSFCIWHGISPREYTMQGILVILLFISLH